MKRDNKQTRRIKLRPVFGLMVLGFLSTVFILTVGSSRVLAGAPTATQACSGESTPCTVPYYVVQGGDIADGAGFQGVARNNAGSAGWNACQKQQTAWFGGYNNDGNLSNASGYKGYYGAAVQGASINTDVNQELATDINSNWNLSNSNANPYTYGGLNNGSGDPNPWAPLSPYYLGFANNFSPSGSNVHGWGADLVQYYGGQFYNNNVPGVTDSGYPPSTAFGGPCQPDYYGNIMTTSPPTLPGSTPGSYTLTSWPSPCKTYAYTGTLTINVASGLPAGCNLTIGVDGNASITHNITYASYGLGSIPSLQISVGTNNMYSMDSNHLATGSGHTNGNCPSSYSSADTNNNCVSATAVTWSTAQYPFSGNGNVFIANNVTEIHGIYTAESAGSFGTIHTCGLSSSDEYSLDGNATPAGATPDSGGCGSPLTIYGALAANDYFLARSFSGGNVLDPTTTTNVQGASELVQYSPEVWIPSTYNSTVTCGGSGSSPAISAVGTLQSHTFSNNTHASNNYTVPTGSSQDLLVLTTMIFNSSGLNASIQNVTSTGSVTGPWTKVTSKASTNFKGEIEMWYAPVASSSGSTTITVTEQGSNWSNHDLELNAQDFNATGSTTQNWSVDNVGNPNDSSGSTIPYPAVTTSNSPVLYVGFLGPFNYPATPVAQTGFNFSPASDGDLEVSNNNYTSNAIASATQSSGGYVSIGATFKTGIASTAPSTQCVNSNWTTVTALPPVL